MGTEIYLRSKEKTDPRYGTDPWKREIRQHLRFGVINLDKPRGPTSHQVVAWVKEILRVSKAGHGGTLDPKVSGVLPVALERSTAIVKYLLGAGKEYMVVMTLHGEVEDGRILEVMDAFTGTILQTPPVKSAVKREPRERVIESMELVERRDRDVLFRVDCEAGTYVRKLCRDMGEALLVGANMSELRRIRSGVFLEKDSCTLQDLLDSYHYFEHGKDEEELRRLIRPVEELVSELPKIWVRDTAVEALCNGARLGLPGVVKCEGGVAPGVTLAVLTLKDELIGVGTGRMSAKEMFDGESGIAADLTRVVMDRGIYPRYWK
jgi:H/ACA ribonucleoprotein complex subunit 4